MGEPGCNAGVYTPQPDQSTSIDRVLANYGVTTENATREEKWSLLHAARLDGDKLSTIIGGSPADAFIQGHGNIQVVFGADMDGCITDHYLITCGDVEYMVQALAHEFFHVFDTHYQNLSTVDDIMHPIEGPNYACANCFASNYLPGEYYTREEYTTGAYKSTSYRSVGHPAGLERYNFTEAFANIGQNWVLEANFDPDFTGFKGGYGDTLRDWMNDNMSIFLGRMGY